MKTTIRIAALLTAVTLVSGCTNGFRPRARNVGTVKLPAAPTIDSNPDATGTVGSPSPSKGNIPQVPSSSPFDAS